VLFAPAAIANGKAVFVCSADLAVATTFGGPYLDKRRNAWSKSVGGAFADTQGIIIVLFGQVMVNALFLGAPARAAFDGQTRGLELTIKPPLSRVHHGRIFQRSFLLTLNPGETFGFPPGTVLLLVRICARDVVRVFQSSLSSVLVLR